MVGEAESYFPGIFSMLTIIALHFQTYIPTVIFYGGFNIELDFPDKYRKRPVSEAIK